MTYHRQMARSTAWLVLPVIAMTGHAAEEDVAQLSKVVVSDSGEETYTTPSSNTATKLDLSLRETPQSVTVFTQQQIEDQALTDTSRILEETPGLSKSQLGHEGAGFVSYYSRGFSVNNFMRDGIPTSAASFGDAYSIGLDDTAIYERVEILKGPSGLLGGSGNPSASINYVRKRPTPGAASSFRFLTGNWQRYRGQIDVSGALNGDGTLRGRSVAVYASGGNQQDRYHKDTALFYGTVDYALGKETLLTAAVTLSQNKLLRAAQHGFVFITDDGYEQTTFGPRDNPATNISNSTVKSLSAVLGVEHQFNDDWRVAVNYSYTRTDASRLRSLAGFKMNYFDPRGVRVGGVVIRPGQMSVHGARFENSPAVHALDTYVSGIFHALGREHQLSFGLNGYQVKADDPSFPGWQYQVVPIAGYDGSVTNTPDMSPNGRRNVTDERQFGGFFAAKIQVADPLKLIVGSRLSTWERMDLGNEQKQAGIFTPYAGVVFDLTANLSAYASYTSIFNPSTRKDVEGKYLNPEDGNSSEVGLKAEFFNRRLNIAASYFHTRQDNLAVRDGDNITPEGDSAYIAVSGAKVKGAEFSIGGELLPGWNISGGYTYTDARDRDGNALQTSVLPRNTFKVFTSYQWDRLTLGGGVNWQSEIYDSTATGLAAQLKRQNAYALVSLMGRYQVNDGMSIALNVNNVLDEVYKKSTTNTWGELRNFMATLNYRF
ncbi:MAG: TonB-dependent siderophore receptor [Steroidobacteraceae bacterium]